jgi:hypothetical protein
MKKVVMGGLLLAMAGCVGGGREIRHMRGCEERLEAPYKRAECRACMERPVPHVFLPDRPDGERCVRQ